MTQNQVISKFSPFIKDYIYKNSWKELRESQIQSASVIFDSIDNLLICSETAGGKTEAALFPILSEMYEQGESNVVALYISPLKALINDQYQRMLDLTDESGISVHHWHGDVSSSSKSDFLKNPRGLLQITPESLESMLINRPNDITRIFANLKYVIIDEVHTLIGTDRGGQVQCQLARISQLISYIPRRIALSATIGDSEKASEWLSDGTMKNTQIINVPKEKFECKLGLESYYLTENSKDGICDLGTDAIYNATKGKKCIIFSNSREETEEITANLRDVAKKRNEDDRFFIHHGNLSKQIREETEFELKNSKKDICAVATVTLELGIDVGKLERIINQGSPISVSGFLQRLGRSGRRENFPEMLMIFREEEALPYAPFYEKIPWELIRAIAIIELYLKERWVEPPFEKNYPASLLFFETLSLTAQKSGMKAPNLAREILSMPPFKHIPHEDYKTLLADMVKKEFLQLTDENELICGVKGERLVSSFKFYAVFKDSEDFGVHCGSEMIGTISSAPPCGERFALAGRVWEVEETDINKRMIFVHKAEGKMKVSWPGSYGDIHTKILQKMREVLSSEEEYPYLMEKSKARLSEARKIAEKTGLCKNSLIKTGENGFVLFPWLGTRGFETAKRLLKHNKLKGTKLFDVESNFVYYISFKCENTEKSKIIDSLSEFNESNIDPKGLIMRTEYPVYDKYDYYLPRDILLNAYSENRFCIKELEDMITRLAEEKI